MFINFKHLQQSFGHAFKGLFYVWRVEQNFRLQVTAAIVIVIVGLVLKIDALEFALLILVTLIVLVLELLNTIFEHLLDIVKPRLHSYVKIMKDIMAAAVLISSIAAIIVGVLIFLPHLL